MAKARNTDQTLRAFVEDINVVRNRSKNAVRVSIDQVRQIRLLAQQLERAMNDNGFTHYATTINEHGESKIIGFLARPVALEGK